MFEPVENLELIKIGVFGIGGAGCNAVNHMIQAGLRGVDFYAVNTDLQALHMNLAENKIQIGAQLTGGTGSGGKPETGRKACEETLSLLREILVGYDMVFIATGEGGGTGTGASPLVAETAREQGSLVVSVVTKPFEFEGRARVIRALDGIEELRPRCDTLIVIPNQKLLEIYPKEPFHEAFRLADEVLYNAVKGITDLVTTPQLVNIDFADVRDVMQEKGAALMGMGMASGADRAKEAASRAICSPLIDDITIETAHRVLLNVTGDAKLTLPEIKEAAMMIQEATRHQADIRFGASSDQTMNDAVRVTVIATGIEEPFPKIGDIKELASITNTFNDRRRKLLTSGQPGTADVIDKSNLEIPAFLRRQID
jgi:cell division protein FtsZ